MPKQKPAQQAGPIWMVARVHRANAGGALYNAVSIKTGTEYFGIPSYDREAIKRRADSLNAEGVNAVRGKNADPWETLDRIAREIDGQETDSETMSNIIEHLVNAGYDLRDPNDVEDETDDE